MLLQTNTPTPKSTNTLIPIPTNTLLSDRWINNGPNAGLIESIAIDPIHTSIIYAGSSGYNTIGQGIYKSLDGGRNWLPFNNGISDWNINSIVIDPKTPSNVYITAGINGIDRSEDGGKTWQTMDIGLLGSMDKSGFLGYVGCLTINPQNPSILYAGMLNGMYRGSSDQGHWIAENLGIPENYGIDSIVIDPKTTTTIYAGATHVNANLSDGIILRSVNGGDNWEVIKTGLQMDNFVKLALNPINTDIIYAGIDEGIYKSIDGGKNWILLKMGIQYPHILSLAIDPMSPNIIYAATVGYGVYKSVNDGQSWESFNNGLSGDDLNVYSLAIDPITPSIVYAGTFTSVYSIHQSNNLE